LLLAKPRTNASRTSTVALCAPMRAARRDVIRGFILKHSVPLPAKNLTTPPRRWQLYARRCDQLRSPERDSLQGLWTWLSGFEVGPTLRHATMGARCHFRTHAVQEETLFDHLIGAGEQCGWNGYTKCFRHQVQQPERLQSKAEYMAAPERFAEMPDSSCRGISCRTQAVPAWSQADRCCRIRP
jgi:hypothetical protein